MSLVSNGIDKVRAFELPAAVWADGRSVAAPRVALVTWRSQWDDRLHQVYVNGRYGGGTVDSAQRQMVVRVPNSFDAPVRIEVFAVEPKDAYVDFGSAISLSGGQTGRVRISFLRQQDLGPGSMAEVYCDNGTGTVSYDQALSDEPIRIWPAWQDKGGFGLSRFGEGDFGWDCAAAVGFGLGSFGRGWFGFDADTFEWVSGSLEAGSYKFGVKVKDGAGGESGAIETGPITVVPAARPAEEVSVGSFDSEANQLVLSIEYE